ncbi:shikimate dehydrogenase [Halogeometricum borinquense DSM 11551]|uniref:Shikimate dehydrogenase (NADP(+)) n=2 Tax=Halogeometricum borinquense (strain ATCC 700274 / DSM 11551 / JCM 10706 / KCTC 4070 / PR3) TaxID=469382 RepID=E4NS13_HALBP|nr:shikimate dehydrogenase [Halogeometricum borinquense DSM 11551]
MSMQVFGLIGNPVGHSLSPPMHEAAYDHCGIDARYVTFEPAPEDIGTAVEGADALGITGLNVTIPFKQDVLEHVEPDELAARIGAVNTIAFTDETPRGYNTDAAGVRRSFTHHDVALADRDAVVVGAGGAGRAAAFALADAEASVHVANRTAERATELADDVPGATGGGLGTLDQVRDADVLVNATSVGMESDDTPVPRKYLHDDLAVLDAVYSPIETRLLRDAAAAGATTIDGAWMLLFQGVEAFERWTGRDAPVEAMNDALRSHLE